MIAPVMQGKTLHNGRIFVCRFLTANFRLYFMIRGPPVSEFENEKSNFGDWRIF